MIALFLSVSITLTDELCRPSFLYELDYFIEMAVMEIFDNEKNEIIYNTADQSAWIGEVLIF